MLLLEVSLRLRLPALNAALAPEAPEGTDSGACLSLLPAPEYGPAVRYLAAKSSYVMSDREVRPAWEGCKSGLAYEYVRLHQVVQLCTASASSKHP